MSLPNVFPNSVRLAPGLGGLPRLEIDSPLAKAQIYLHGAHVASYTKAGERPLLFLSEKSHFRGGEPIRGGVPIIFPWFGGRQDGADLPAHGFARRCAWAAEAVRQEDDGTVQVELRLKPDRATGAVFNNDWVARYRVRVGSELTLELEVTNTGSAPFRYEEALHTYFSVSDVRNIAITGLEETEYLSAIEEVPRKRQNAKPIRFEGELDRAYLNTEATCVIEDPGFDRRIIVEKAGSQSTVVWNPWIDKAQRMADFGDDEWKQMVCVESGNVRENQREVIPGERQTLRVTLRSEAL
ncbi:MAG TPA: D-hexose-6-phosphate mutarotase [Chthoniobacteraceae bacterium]|nr:D-hexose-6-phosphate mutarotase [Chthoniobacteraceae bacterium]